MKNILTAATFIFSLASTSAYAHHPAADNVDPEIYANIDEMVSDTPHADMTFDDMGGRMDDSMDNAIEQDRDEISTAENINDDAAMGDVTMGNDIEITDTSEAASDARDTLDTMGLMDNVMPELSE